MPFPDFGWHLAALPFGYPAEMGCSDGAADCLTVPYSAALSLLCWYDERFQFWTRKRSFIPMLVPVGASCTQQGRASRLYGTSLNSSALKHAAVLLREAAVNNIHPGSD